MVKRDAGGRAPRGVDHSLRRRVTRQVMPKVLSEHGKTKNPFPNVDSHSGVLLR